MAIKDLKLLTANAGAAHAVTRADALSERQRETLDRTGVIMRLRARIERDEVYLARRARKGLHTPTDDALSSDLRVFALAITYLEERQEERIHTRQAPRGSHCISRA